MKASAVMSAAWQTSWTYANQKKTLRFPDRPCFTPDPELFNEIEKRPKLWYKKNSYQPTLFLF